MFQIKIVQRNQTHFLFNKNHVVYETMWKNMAELRRPQTTIWRMRVACWVANATNTNSGHVKLIAFPRPQLLREGTSVLLYMYIANLVKKT
jgi:hypothetical protein